MSNVDDIPIDPALRGAIDPALMVEGESMIVEQVSRVEANLRPTCNASRLDVNLQRYSNPSLSSLTRKSHAFKPKPNRRQMNIVFVSTLKVLRETRLHPRL